MNLTKEIAQLGTARPYRSLWRTILRRVYPLDPQTFLARIDPVGLEKIAARYADVAVQRRVQWPKYLRPRVWVQHAVRQVHDLALHRAPKPLRILDLGSGPGYFLFVCRQLGHEGLGLDLADPPLYAELFELMGLQRVVWRINPLEPLPEMDGRKFDLVTGFAINFHRRADETMWDAAEWKFFLEDLRGRFLAPGGKIVLDLNPGPDGVHITPGVRDYFQSVGGVVERSRVIFPAAA